MTSQQPEPEQNSAKPDEPPGTSPASTQAPVRQYEKSGLYPENGKPFRMWALFGWLTLLIVVLAGLAALLNFMLLDT